IQNSKFILMTILTNEELWQIVLAQIQFSVSRANFATWLKSTNIISNKNGEITICVENSFAKEWINNKYSSLILKILRNLDPEIKSLDFLINPYNPLKKILEETKNNPLKKLKEEEEIISTRLPLRELSVDKKTNLNPSYSFNNFIVGSFNQMAQAAAWAISEAPGSAYNPLFIYGGVGLGKTHLIQATGNRIAELFPNKKIKYISCERLVSEIIDAIKSQKIADFKKESKEIDVFIIDDIQFFTGKEKSQEEFFHIFNLLYHSQKQIIVSSDVPPKAIPSLEKRLMSRFEGGMIIDIGIPDIETRMAILKTKAMEKNLELENEILEYISSNIRDNIRELEGALNKLLFFKKMNNQTLDFETVKHLLKNLILFPKKKTNFKNIVQAVSNFYNLTEKELFLISRRKEIVKPRQIIMYLLREELKESFPCIGRKFNGKDHTTVMYAWDKINKGVKENDDLLSEINSIKQKLYNMAV
ncbi:chromosomal replication initiator protein DnaA, partial [Patescibacteria group bacterium]|nr:chromosomal replication initiator protein DnaA [Patescibacteria group bacterium]